MCFAKVIVIMQRKNRTTSDYRIAVQNISFLKGIKGVAMGALVAVAVLNGVQQMQ